MWTAPESSKFEIAPDFAIYVWHLKFIYNAPKSFRARDIVMLTEQSTFSSAEIDPRSQNFLEALVTQDPVNLANL